MAINVSFNNISQANSEILKAFNSSTSARALEAYQPLSSKQRKLEKLRALQMLKQSSESQTLADISLSTTSLSVALGKAEGATLQAMLNLLSAKMIQQNKYTYVNETQAEDIKAKVKKKLEDNKQERDSKKDKKEQKSKKDESKDDDLAVDKLVNAVVTYFEEIRDDFIEKYKKFLSAVSLENIQKAFNEGVALVKRYTYEAPLEFFNEYVVEPINDFRDDLKSLLDGSLKAKVKNISSKSFSSTDIKSMLNKSFVKNHTASPKATPPQKEEKDQKLQNTVDVLNNSLILKKKIKNRKKLKVHSAEEIKLALHR